MPKPKATPKLDATVKAEDQFRPPLPEYSKPPYSLVKEVKVGQHIFVAKRVLNSAGSAYDLVELEGEVLEVGESFIRMTTEAKPKTIPWYSIHDWDIIDAEGGSDL